MRTSTYWGVTTLSTRRSPTDKWTCASYPVSDCNTASPERRKPKKHMHDTAQSMTASDLLGSVCQTCLSARKIEGVMGYLVLDDLPAVLFFNPLVTHSNWGIAPMRGSPRPNEICVWRTAAK